MIRYLLSKAIAEMFPVLPIPSSPLSVMWSSEKNGKTGDTGASFGPVGDCEKPTGGDTGDARRGAWGFIPVFSV